VTVNGADAVSLQPEVRELLDEGLLDAVQLHGAERPDACHALWPSYFKAFRPAGTEDAAGGAAFRCPRILRDAAAAVPGGTGRKVADAVLDAWTLPLWLAGGINPENVAEIIARWRPELIDAASGVEAAPGRKDAGRLERLFKGIDRAGNGAWNGKAGHG
jgi:indole-3-glycerol phosphate synthase/phosphoribosylanthranilate isomerase